MVVYCYDATITTDLLHNHTDGDNTSLTLSRFVDMVVLQVVY